MDEILTLGEWLLVDDPETDDELAVRCGTVRFHSKNRDEV